MSSIIYLTAVFFMLLALQSYNSSTGNQKKLKSQWLNQNHRSAASLWPSFPNDNNSYVYLLGLFLEQRFTTETGKHFQTSVEPVMFQAAILLSQKLNITINGKQIAYHVEATSGRNVIEALDRTCRAIQEYKILGIVGPEYSSEAKTLASFGNRAGLPVIGYSTTEPELSDRNSYKTFYRLSASDVFIAQALLKLFKQYLWNSTNIIYQGDSYGQGGLHALDEAFGNEIKISRSIRFDLFTERIDNLKRQLEESPSRIVIVMAAGNVTTKIIRQSLEAGEIMAPSFLWILTASNSLVDIPNDQNVNQLVGMLMLRQVSPQAFNQLTETNLLNESLNIWEEIDPHSFQASSSKVDIFALYAFNAAWLLILALQQLCQRNSTNCLSFENSSNCFEARLTAQEEFHKILQTITFIGLTGRVQFHSNTTDRIDDTGVYYVIDNIQPAKMSTNKFQIVEVLELNGSLRYNNYNSTTAWRTTGNMIRWPGQQNEIPTDYALLRGKTLNITVYISPPFFMQSAFPNIHGKYLYEGYIHELLLLLKDKMEFNYSYSVASNETSYDELVECVENRTCEIVMADLATTATRLAKIDFSTSIYDNALRLVVRKSKQKTISPIAFLKPFSTWLWLGIIFVIYILSVILIGLYEYQEERNGIDSSSLMRILGRSLYHTIGALVQRGSELQVKTLFARIQTVTVWLMSVVIVALLTSNLTIYFTAQREQPWLKSIDDLNMCQKVDCKRIGVVERSQHEEYFTKEVTDNIEMNYHHLKHPTECFTKLLDGHIDVSLADSSSAEYYTQTEYCQLELAGEPFGKTHFAVALPKYWPYKQDLDTHILELRTNGEIDRRLATYFQQRNCDVINENQPNIEDGGLTIFQTSGLFIIFGVLTGLNFMFYVMNRVGILSSIALSVQKIRGYYGSESITVDPERVANPTELVKTNL
ncbi:unnamed protein product [Rotaria magnacalcarata]|uniref:Ionotropic glutamate receptor C-terminal domain-containing protein n=2 Tax=Rotaria magnacalcarata TaxID=392030 RepID=A0A819GLL0_9BILA|nr:unnamed protein product [Rotaria magnacalcarata]